MGFGEHPIVESCPRHVVPKQRTNVAFTLPIDEPLLGLKASQDAVHPARVTFRDLEFAGAQIQQRQPPGFGGPMDGCDIVIGLAFKHVVVHHQSRSHQFRDASLHQSLGLLGIFKLVAHGHLQSRFDELGQVGVEAVVWESSQFHFRGAAVASFGEDDVQHLGCGHRIGPKRFIKVAHPKQQHGVRMLDLDPVVLLHQRGLFASLR